MLVERITSGNRDCYVGTISLSLLKQSIERSSTEENMFPQLEKEEKAVNEIAEFIVQSITHDQSWLMGGLTVAIYPFPDFRPLSSEYNKGESSGIWGDLALTGKETWVLIDGYHRMAAMLKALSMLLATKRKSLAESGIPILLVPSPTSADRQELLLRMHKSARSGDRGEIIRTTVNDTYAIYARWLMGEDKEHQGVISKDLINWKSNTLTNRLCKFSTLSVLYDSAKMLSDAFGFTPTLNSTNKTQQYNEIAQIWNLLLTQLTPFRQAVNGTPNNLPLVRERFLCLKPTGQLIVVAVMALALRLRKDIAFLEEVIERLNEVPWSINDPLWQKTIISEGRIKGTGLAITHTSRLVAHLIGIPLSDSEVQSLKQAYRGESNVEDTALPKPLFPLLNEL